MTTGERIRERREALGLSQEEVAIIAGYKGKSSISKIESSGDNVTLKHVKKMAKALHCHHADLLGWASSEKGDSESKDDKPKWRKMPVLGHVAAGVPIEAIEDILGYEYMLESEARGGVFYALRIKGDSMTPLICDGDIVIVKQQEYAEDNDIVIAMTDEGEATCKRLKKYGDKIGLFAVNPHYPPLFFAPHEEGDAPIKILGRVVEMKRRFGDL